MRLAQRGRDARVGVLAVEDVALEVAADRDRVLRDVADVDDRLARQLRLGERVVLELELGCELHQARPVRDRCGSSSGVEFGGRADLLPRPAPFEPDEPGVALLRDHVEPQRVVEPVVQVHAVGRDEPEPELEAPLGERQLVDVEAEDLLACAVPAERRRCRASRRRSARRPTRAARTGAAAVAPS